MAIFFIGRRVVDKGFSWEKGGKARLEWTVSEYWDRILSETIRCGAKGRFRQTRRVGITETQKRELEASLSASLGLGDLGPLKSKIQAKASIEVSWNVIEETERTTEFTAPKCGNYGALQYQKMREFDFHYQDDRWLHKDSWQYRLTEHTCEIHDDSKTCEPDPNCGCRPDETNPRDYDGLLHADFGAVSALAGYRTTPGGLDVSMFGKDFQFEGVDSLSFNRAIELGRIHPSLVFLGNLQLPRYVARFSPYIEPAIIESEPRLIIKEIRDVEPSATNATVKDALKKEEVEALVTSQHEHLTR